MSSISGEQARRIRVVLLDADGVMTDGGLYVSADEDRVTEGPVFHSGRGGVEEGDECGCPRPGGESGCKCDPDPTPAPAFSPTP